MERDFGYRKIQRTGRGSYIISLPKNWVKDIGLEKGNEVYFKLLDDSSLLLVPRTIMEGGEPTEHKVKESRVLVDPTENPQTLSRKIISLYVVSVELIHLHFQSRELVSKYKPTINSLVRNTLLGSEIIDETPNEITLQVLVNHPDFPIEKAIRRMAILSLSSNRDSILMLNTDDHILLQNIINAQNDVNRLSLYVIRQLKFGLERNLFKKMGFQTPKEFLGYRIIANDLKSIADNAMNIAQNIMTFKHLIEDQTLFLKKPLDEEVYDQIRDFNSSVHHLFEESLKAMFKRDYESSDRIISQFESFMALENDLVILISSKKLDPNISSIFRLILDNSRRIVEYCKNIAEVTLNRTIEELMA